MSDPWRIDRAEQLEELLGSPSDLVKAKVSDRLDEWAAAFVARSPLLFLATASAGGRVEVSPKGDAPGFVHVEGDRVLLLPERIGNKLVFGFRNILENPRVGLLFLVPGTTETLRVGGTASLTRDPALCERLAAQGKPALMVTRIEVDECFFHCGKAFLRSSLWKAATWPPAQTGLAARSLASRSGPATDEAAVAVEAFLAESYRTRLY